MKENSVLLYAVGDLHPDREDPASIFACSASTLQAADILFGQLESTLSEKGDRQMQGFYVPRVHPRNVKALAYAGFDVISFASNHTMHLGVEGLFNTMNVLKQNGIAVVGAGENIVEARKPVILERNGAKVAFLAYCSVLPKGYEAEAEKPGAAPMRATTYYEQVDWQAGTLPKIVTIPRKEDLEALKEDIRKTRPLADVLVLSMHWGVHHTPGVIAMYQREVAYAAIDAGVDLILGHHAHMLKAIEVYKGKVIFYSLGNFAFDAPLEMQRHTTLMAHLDYDPEYPNFAFPAESRKTMVAKCTIVDKKIATVSFLPAMVNKKSQPEILPQADVRSDDVFDYVKWSCKDQKINTGFSRQGDEIFIES